MAKAKTTAFFCKECGYESSKWMGQCPGCRQWNTMVEEPVAKAGTSSRRALGLTGGDLTGSQIRRPVKLDEVSLDEQDRISTGYQNWIVYWGAALCPAPWF